MSWILSHFHLSGIFFLTFYFQLDNLPKANDGIVNKNVDQLELFDDQTKSADRLFVSIGVGLIFAESGANNSR